MSEMSERERLIRLIADLDRQRGALDDAVIDAALGPLEAELARLEAGDPATQSGRPAERRVMTVLFCDVVGSTALAEGMDPEEWTEIMNAAFERLNEPVARYGGKVARLMGDAILAFFGAPLAHENDPERAVMAGLDILGAVEPYRQELRREKGLEFNVRVGINTGLAVVGEVGSAVHGEYTAMGDAINVAARMEQTAAPGSVQISADTYRHIAPLFDCEALGDIAVKGKSLPVQAYRVLQRSSRPGPVRGLYDRGLESQMVGREAELAAVTEAVRLLSTDGEGGLVLVFGEAGLGKSRLKEEVRRAAGDTPRWLEGSAPSFGQDLGYWSFQKILQEFAGIGLEDDEAAAWAKLEHSVVSLHGKETDDILPYLASLLAIEVQEPYADKVKYLDGEALGKQLYLASRRFFERLAQARPLVLVFEDMHWMDDASARLLEHLLPLINRVPLLVIGLSRPGPKSAGERVGQMAHHEDAGRYTEVRLSPLPASSGSLLVNNLLAVDEVPAQMRRDILDRAGGNPFFLEEILRTLIEIGALEREASASPSAGYSSGRWRAAEGIDSIQLPDTVQGVVMARVDRLTEEVKQVLRTASVIGRSFFYRVLQSVIEDERELTDNLSTLESVDLIQEKERLSELEYMFKHALAQEAVYESILLQSRRKTHRLVAQSIESLYEDRLEEFYGVLAFHYAQAEAWDRALEYLLKAGDLAEQVAADDEALAHYHKAISAYERAFGDRWDPLQRAKLERKVGRALLRRGDHEQALEHIERALGLLGRPLPSTKLGTGLAILVEAIKQLAGRLAPGMLRKPGSSEAYAVEKERALDYGTIVALHMAADPKLVMLASLRALNVSESIGYEDGMVEGYLTLSLMFAIFKGFRFSAHYERLARELVSTLDRADYAGRLIANRAYVHERKVELEQAVEAGQEAAHYFRKAGMLRMEGNVNVVVAEALLASGRFDEAEATALELLEKGQDMGDKQVVAWAKSQLALVKRYEGQPEMAVELFRQSGDLAHETHDRYGRTSARANVGHCYLQMGRLAPAVEALQEAQEFSSGHRAGARVRSILDTGLAWAGILSVESGAGGPQLDEVDRACKRAMKSTRRHPPSQAQALRLRGTGEWLRGREDKALDWWEQSLARAAEIGQPYEQALTYWEMGRRLEEPDHLETAASLLREIGARPDLLEKLRQAGERL